MFYNIENTIVPICGNLENSGSAELAVNGLSTPVIFSFGPTSGLFYYITSLSLFFNDPGSDSDEFGALSALTNGLKIAIDINSTEYEIVNFKQNKYITMFFLDNGSTRDDGIINETSSYIGGYKFPYPIMLNGNNNDKIKAVVRDNISGLSNLNILVHGYREI